MRLLILVGVFALIVLIFASMQMPKGSSSSPSSAAYPPAPPPAATPASPPSLADRQWGEFVIYGPQLVGVVKRAEAVNNTMINQVPDRITAGNRGSLYNEVDKAAQSHARLKAEVHGIRVPAEAKDFHDRVFSTMIALEDSMNKLKEALDKPSAGSEAAYLKTRDESKARLGRAMSSLLALCRTMNATVQECNSAVGLAT